MTQGDGISPGLALRLLDVVVSVFALIVFAPLLLVLAVVIGRSGPVLYRQQRVGQGGRPFTVYKLRTMRVAAGGPEVTAPGDARVTRLGARLRASSIDELPQFINVLRGEMTLTGPRPETVSLAERYPEECRAVFQYRPGLTGPVQLELRDVDVLRPDVEDLEEYYLTSVVPRRVAVDLEFASRRTVGSTLGLVLRTALLVSDVKRANREARPSRDVPAPVAVVTSTVAAGGSQEGGMAS